MVSVAYLTHVGVLFGINFLVLVSLNFTAGYCGMLSVAHAVFFGVGAYAGAYAALWLSPEIFVTVAAGVATAAGLAAIVGPWLVRLHGDFFILVTFALQMIAYELFVNLRQITGGVNGLSGIPAPHFLGFEFDGPGSVLLLTMFFALGGYLAATRVHGSRLRRVMIGLREDELHMATMGFNVVFDKALVFMVSAALAGGAGTLYAQYISYIAPKDFELYVGLIWLVALMLGGGGAALAPVLGAALIVFLPEVLRFVGIPGQAAGNVHQVLIGAAFLTIILWRPLGILRTDKSNERFYD